MSIADCKGLQDLAAIDTRPCTAATAMSGDHPFDYSNASNHTFMTAAAQFGFGGDSNGTSLKLLGTADVFSTEAGNDAEKWKKKHKHLKKEHQELLEKFKKLETKLARVCEKLKDQSGEEALCDVLQQVDLER